MGVLAAVALVLWAACPGLEAGRGRFEKKARNKGWDYPKLTTYTFIEDGKRYRRLTLCANVELAMFRLGDPYLPVLFALASELGPALRVTPERFRLILPDGTELVPVPYAGLLEKGYKSEMIHDWSRRRTIDVTHGHFAVGYRRIVSRFYPDPAGRPHYNVVLDAEIGRDAWVQDVLYFPNPGGLAGKELVLAYEDPLSGPGKDLVRAIEVRFRIPDPSRAASDRGD
jgi:hypothetical protein